MALDLEKIRGEINAIDDEIVKLYIKRLSLCDEVAESKRQTGKAVLDRSREEKIIERITDGMDEKDSLAVTGMYKRIFEISRARQTALLYSVSDFYKSLSDKEKENIPFPEKATVACQGVDGAYSSIACKTLFKEPKAMFFESFESVFKAVDSGLCKYGILPFENSIYGSVTEVYDLLSHFKGYVVRSVKLPIHHALLAKKGVSISEIREIYSHRQAIGQCSEFLNKNKECKVVICENTAMAARMVSESDRNDIAAICSESCAEKYSLEVKAKNIQNSSVNYTRFYCISKEPEIFPVLEKIAFMFDTANKAGSLESVLSRFSLSGINLTKIESRPIPGKDFQFMFYAEADINGLDEKLLRLFTQLENELAFFKFIGAYEEIAPKETI